MGTFQNIIGQDAIKTHMREAARTGHPAQSYGIEGERLSGKKLLAETFAAALLCETGGGEPCGTCHSCRMAASGNHPDIIHTRHEKPNAYRVQEIREQVAEDVFLRPYYGPFKVYIIDEAEKMDEKGQNALLKTLEDPPDYAVLLLLTTSMTRFLPTIRSRCVTFSVAPIADEQIVSHLLTLESVTPEAAHLAAAFAQGNLGRAIALAKSEAFITMRDRVVALLAHLNERTPDEVLAEAEDLEERYRGQMTELFDLFVIWFRDVLLYKASGAKEELVFREESYAVSQTAARSSYAALKGNIHAISHARRQLSARVADRRVLEQLLLALA